MAKFLVFILLLFYATTVAAQNICEPSCQPDASCIDALNPGQVCPGVLSQAHVDKHYHQTLTIIPPSTYRINEKFGIVRITKIEITAIEGLPEGIAWCKNLRYFTVTDPESRYCCVLSGVPVTEGEYPLRVKIKPFFKFLGKEIAPVSITDKSLLLTVKIRK